MAAVNEIIQKVMADFKWRKIHRVMVALNWQWRDIGVPSIEQLQTEATDLLERVLEDTDDAEHHSVGTGGLRATRWGNHLSLEFILDQNDVEIETT